MNILNVNGRAYPIVPSAISPGTEIIKKSERTLSGRLCVDYVIEKTNLEIIWDVVSDAQLKAIKNDFMKGDAFVRINYFAESGGVGKGVSGAESENSDGAAYYFDGIAYTPYFIGGELMWQNVSVKMLEE